MSKSGPEIRLVFEQTQSFLDSSDPRYMFPRAH